MALAGLPTAALLPGEMPDEELFWHWRRSLLPMFDCVPLHDPRNPLRSVFSRQYHAGDFLFVDARFPQQRFRRDAAWRRRHDDADHLLLQVFLRGSNGGQNGGTEFVEEPGGVFAVNLGYETDSSSNGADTLSLVLPRHWVAEHLPMLRDTRGALFPPGSMAARLFTDFMLSLQRNLPAATAADGPLLSRSLIGLLSSLSSDAEADAVDARSGALMAIRRYIDENLADPELGPERLCARFRMSRATLFRMFKALGGVRTHIQQRRLIACFRALGSPRYAGRPIYDVALDFGLGNPSHLSALFREHFGMSPREVREAAGRPGAERGPDDGLGRDDWPTDVERMRRWASDLGRSRERSRDPGAAATRR